MEETSKYGVLGRYQTCSKERISVLNSGEFKKIFTIILCFVIIGLTNSGRARWQEEDTRKDTSIVLIHQEQSCTSELFKVIQDAVSLIFLDRIMLLFRATSSSTLIMSDVQSIIVHHKFGIDAWRSKN